jgi:hypothetical protein
MPAAATADEATALAPKQVRRDPSGRDAERPGDLAGTRTGMLREIVGDVILGDLTGRRLPEQGRPRAHQPVPFVNQRSVSLKLAFNLCKTPVDLGEDSSGCASVLARCVCGHATLQIE